MNGGAFGIRNRGGGAYNPDVEEHVEKMMGENEYDEMPPERKFKITFWETIKHWFGFHAYGERIFPPVRDKEDEENTSRGSYHRCKVCGEYEI